MVKNLSLGAFPPIKISRLLRTVAWMLMLPMTSMAQNISGRVTSPDDGGALAGVNILIKGTTTGTYTNSDGGFQLTAASSEAVLIFSFVGFVTQEITLNGRGKIDVSLQVDATQLKEVVVTALGIEKDKKALGYATQSVDGSQLVQARETNLVSALSGKIAGVNIVSNPSGIGSSSRITIRGERSLNINNNQPLFVVDGLPISNSFTGSAGSPGGRNQDVDYGNGAGFINPDDIESVTYILLHPVAFLLVGLNFFSIGPLHS